MISASDDGAGWFDTLRELTRESGGGLRANPAAVAAASEVGTAFGDSLTQAAPSFAPAFEEAASAARSWSWAAIVIGGALAIAGVGFIVWNIRKGLS